LPPISTRDPAGGHISELPGYFASGEMARCGNEKLANRITGAGGHGFDNLHEVQSERLVATLDVDNDGLAGVQEVSQCRALSRSDFASTVL